MGGEGLVGSKGHSCFFVVPIIKLGKKPGSSAVAGHGNRATALTWGSLRCRQLLPHKAGSRGSIQQAMRSTASQAPHNISCSAQHLKHRSLAVAAVQAAASSKLAKNSSHMYWLETAGHVQHSSTATAAYLESLGCRKPSWMISRRLVFSAACCG